MTLAIDYPRDAARPSHFEQLDLDIFPVFSGGNRVLYEPATLAAYTALMHEQEKLALARPGAGC